MLCAVAGCGSTNLVSGLKHGASHDRASSARVGPRGSCIAKEGMFSASRRKTTVRWRSSNECSALKAGDIQSDNT